MLYFTRTPINPIFDYDLTVMLISDLMKNIYKYEDNI